MLAALSGLYMLDLAWAQARPLPCCAGQAKGAVHTQSHKAVLENAWSSAMSDSMTADLAKAIASQVGAGSAEAICWPAWV